MKLFLYLLFFSAWAVGLQADDANVTQIELNQTATVAASDERIIEFEYELDAYYSNISWTIPLGSHTIPDAADKSEFEIYYDLLKEAIPPQFLIVELSVNPLPVLGVYLKENRRSYYESVIIFEDLNVIEAVTAGFQEPYALSFFLGNTVKFTEPGATRAGSNRAYAGLLVSLTDKHIKQNVLIEDRSMELEWKIIGSRSLDDYKLGWSYRIGTRLHENPEITDSVYLGIRRSRLDFESDALSFLNNSAVELKSTFSIEGLYAIGHEIYFEKKFPVTLWDTNFGVNFGVGYFYQGPYKYSGSLKEEGIQQDQIIIRPNIQF